MSSQRLQSNRVSRTRYRRSPLARYGGLSVIQTARQNLYPAFHSVHPLYEPLQGDGLTPIHECLPTMEDEDGGDVRQGVGVGVFPHVYTSPFMGDDLGVGEGGSEILGVGEGGSEGVGVGVDEGDGTFLSPVQEGNLLMTTDLIYIWVSLEQDQANIIWKTTMSANIIRPESKFLSVNKCKRGLIHIDNS